MEDVAYDAVALIEASGAGAAYDHDAITKELGKTYTYSDIREALDEIDELAKEDLLFAKDIYRDFVMDFKKRKTVVKALCLNVSHDCNLGCKYCFAGEGAYHGSRGLMSFEVGKKALDFLVENSGHRINLEVDFFGGEPLMNWEVIKQIVEYGRSLEVPHHKKFRFTLTTNGVLVNEEVMEFCNREMANVVMSLDGGIVGRQRRRGRFGPGGFRPGFGHRRFDPPAGGSVRRGRPEAGLRSSVTLRSDLIRIRVRRDRSDHPHGP